MAMWVCRASPASLALIVWRRRFHIDLGQGLRPVAGQVFLVGTVVWVCILPSRSAPKCIGWLWPGMFFEIGVIAGHRKAPNRCSAKAALVSWSCDRDVARLPIWSRSAWPTLPAWTAAIVQAEDHRLTSTDRAEL
jgi:hypothetical protein